MFNPLCGLSLRRGSRRIAIMDIILFFITLIVCVTLEWAVFKSKPMKIIICLEDDCQYPEDEEIQVGKAVWTHLGNGLHAAQHLNAAFGYIVYTVTLLFFMGYIILEIWLCCVLIRASTEKKAEFCKTWFWWRVATLVFSAVFSLINIAQMQYTATDIAIQPLNILRLYSLIVVHQLQKKLSRIDRKLTF